MQINNNNKQSFGMTIHPDDYYPLSKIEKYVFYKLNQKIAGVKGPNLECSIIKDYFGFSKNKPAKISGLKSSTNISQECEGKVITINDLQGFVDKVLASKNRVKKFIYQFYPKSEAKKPEYYGLPYNIDELTSTEEGIKELSKGDKNIEKIIKDTIKNAQFQKYFMSKKELAN